jgi:hypothetical protein
MRSYKKMSKTKKGWRYGSSGRMPPSKCEALSSYSRRASKTKTKSPGME